MKRSEMKQKIQSVIESFFHNEDPKYGFLAEYILEEVEKGGMLPPPEYTNPISIDNKHGIVIEASYPNAVDSNGQFPLWEPESE